MSFVRRSLTAAPILALLQASPALAEAPVQSTVTRLPVSNGYSAAILDLSAARLNHFREHLFATEEPLFDANGNEVYVGNQPQAVNTRNLAYDAYFGVRANGSQGWLTSWTVDREKSGYAAWSAGKTAGTGTMVQTNGALRATT